jgi:hypothetical protein
LKKPEERRRKQVTFGSDGLTLTLLIDIEYILSAVEENARQDYALHIA